MAASDVATSLTPLCRQEVTRFGVLSKSDSLGKSDDPRYEIGRGECSPSPAPAPGRIGRAGNPYPTITMVFSSASFLFYFLPVVLALYFSCVSFGRVRNWILLAASLFFYTWGEGEYVLVMLLSILANYLFGLWVYKAHERNDAKVQMGVAIAFNLLLLVIFKYIRTFWWPTPIFCLATSACRQ